MCSKEVAGGKSKRKNMRGEKREMGWHAQKFISHEIMLPGSPMRLMPARKAKIMTQKRASTSNLRRSGSLSATSSRFVPTSRK